MKSLLSKIIGPEQVGYMPDREARDNITKSLNLIHHANNSEIKGLSLSIDVEKAFDRVSWNYILSTCSTIGMGNNMSNWIKALYHNPQAKIKINNIFSNPINIRNGTGQRCPLSPLLFILTLEPLIRTINFEIAIQGFHVNNREYKSAAYADDLFISPYPTPRLHPQP